MNEIFDPDKTVPFFGFPQDFEELERIVSDSTDLITKSSNVREMILETWLALDYVLRGFILGAFGLLRFYSEDFDPRYRLLPFRFESLLQLLREITKWQGELYDQDKLTEEPKLAEITFTGSALFWKRLQEQHPDALPKIKQVETEILLEKFPDRAEEIERRYLPKLNNDPWKREVARVPEDWLKVAWGLEDEWFKKARRLSKARNFAAHSHRAEKILEVFGIAGDSALELTRSQCLNLLSDLLGVKSTGDK